MFWRLGSGRAGRYMAMTPATIAMPPAQSEIMPSMRAILVRILAGVFLASLFVPLIGGVAGLGFRGGG